MKPSKLDAANAQQIAANLRDVGWDVKADHSPLGWGLVATAADGGKPLYGRTYNDMRTLIAGGQVARLETGTRTASGRCSKCGSSGFGYNGNVSRDGVRGYHCMACGTIKPERTA